jgi:hypothetical protein
MREEDEKAANLCLGDLTKEMIQENARNTRLKHDGTYVANEELIKWRQKVSLMSVKKFWDEMKLHKRHFFS